MIIHCRNCKNRYTTDCPMLFEEYVEWDDDGYHESDYIVHDNTVDAGFCDRAVLDENEGNIYAEIC